MAFRTMRRNKQELSSEACNEVLLRNTAAVLSVQGDDGYPYGVPISYAFDGSRIIIHSALAGHKVDAIAANPKVSLCIIDRDDVVPQEYTTYYRSVIVFGKARIIADEQEKRSALQAFAAKYTPDDEKGRLQEVEKTLHRVCLIEVLPEHVTGKEATELARARMHAATRSSAV